MVEITTPKIIVDSREMNGGVPKALDRMGVDIEIRTMEVGDYCVSDRCAFERKEINDFMNSWLVEKKLFSQIGDLARAYERPVLIIEGGNPLYAGHNVHPNAIQGLLNTIAVSFRVPILYSDSPADTANIIIMIARREQSDEKRSISVHGKRTNRTDNEQLEYALCSLPDMGLVTARNLLTHFGTLKEIINAEEERLTHVKLVGKETAHHVKEFFERRYK
jgi:Fanconi anemia group M protein